MSYKLGKHYCYLTDVTQDEVQLKTYKQDDKKVLIEDLITNEEIIRFCTATHTPTMIKPLFRVDLSIFYTEKHQFPARNFRKTYNLFIV